MTGAKHARGVEVAFSTAQLDDAGITDDLDDMWLGEIVDDYFLTYSQAFAEHVQQWLQEMDRDRYGSPEHEAWLIEMEAREG